ncbi:MAG: hypothetical protein IT324_05905 [Anaerolineae bacterium]|nr:hypothetical protein [Anaerolineae bacterium]
MLDSPATLLYRLQTLDLAIAQRRARLREIEAVLGKDEQVTLARQQLDAAEQALKPWQTRARDLDLEIKSLAQKIKETDRALYGGKVRNPKELQDMQDDIASMQRRQSQLEDDLLDAMMHSDEGQTAIGGAEQALKQAQARFAGSQHDLLDEQARLQRELTDLEAKRQQAAAGIDKDALTKYEALRVKKRGQAVALMQEESCKTCGVEQTSMIAQQVRQGSQLVYCNSCGRILAAQA